MKLEICEDQSWTTNLFNAFIMPIWRWTRTRPISPLGSQALKPAFVSGCDVTERKINGIYVYDLVSKKILSKLKKRVLHFPGGAFLTPASGLHFRLGARICRESPETMVTFVAYPLAPLSPASTTFPQLVELYKQFVAEATEAGQELIISGDSAGGNLALALPLHVLLTEEAIPAPKNIVAIVPVCTFDTEILYAVADSDPALSIALFKDMRTLWGGEWDEKDPRIAPLYADVDVLKARGVEVNIVTAGNDCCAPGALLLQDKLAKAGVEGTFSYWPGMQHLSFILFGLGITDFTKMANAYFRFYR